MLTHRDIANAIHIHAQDTNSTYCDSLETLFPSLGEEDKLRVLEKVEDIIVKNLQLKVASIEFKNLKHLGVVK